MYWTYYKDKDEITKLEFYGNQNEETIDLGGRKASELYVPQKYSTYKEEILRHIPMRYYKDYILIKLNQYQNSEKIKQTTSWAAPFWPHYNVRFNEPMTKNHILSVILYCDFDEYQNKFSSTFRKLSYTESFESVKNRNRDFWFQSKYLRETVQLFGLWEYDERCERDPRNPISPSCFIKGPYFTGLNRVMAIPQFALALHSPTSTTKDIEVSVNFSGRDGLIVEFSRKTGASKEFNFDCSWLSRYPDENECLFMSGVKRIFVQSVRIIGTAKYYDFKSLAIMDGCLFNYGRGRSVDIELILGLSKKDAQVLYMVLKKDEILSSSKVSPFMSNVYRAYYRQKTHINIHLAAAGLYEKIILLKANSGTFDPMMPRIIIEDNIESCNAKDFDPTNVNLRCNLISPDIFRIFPYCRSLNIRTNFGGNDGGEQSWPFNMHQFLAVISQSSLWESIQIAHIIGTNSAIETNWISKTWGLISEELIKAYNLQQLTIQFKSYQIKRIKGKKNREDFTATKFVITRQTSNANQEPHVKKMGQSELISIIESLSKLRCEIYK